MMAVRSRSSSSHSIPAWPTASRAAITENCAKRSMKADVLVGEVIFSSVAMYEGGVLEADGAVFRLFKLSNARFSLDQRSPELFPVEPQRGDNANPGNGDARHLIRLRGLFLRFQKFRHAVDHLVDIPDMPRLLIVDLDVELALQVEEDVDAVHRVDTELLE